MLKKALSCFLLISLMISLSACYDTPSCSYLLVKVLAVSGENTDGNGYLYFAKAQEGEIEYFSDELYSVMFGEGAKERYFSKIEDFAIFVSQRTAGELAIFKCFSRSDTDDIAEMCLKRADDIKVALKDSEYEEKSKTIKVEIYGNIVVLYFIDEPKKAEKKLKGLI